MTTAHSLGFGDLLRRHRKAAGMTQEELAERAGLSTRAVSDIERGIKSRPHRDTVRLLAEALDLDEAERAAFEAARGRGTPTALSANTPDGAAATAARRGEGLPPFVGRLSELTLLERHLAGDGPPVLMLAGEPGIGKSRLLREAAARADTNGWYALSGGCQRRGGQEPYAPLLAALKAHLRHRSQAQLRADLHGCAWLVRLLPELAGGPIEPLPAWTLPPEQERRLMFEAVERFLANVAGPAGTLLLLDDLQWAGSDALDLLATLARSTIASVRLVGAFRDSEVAPRDALSIMLADLAHAGLATQRTLAPLSAAEAGELLAAVLELTDDRDGLRERVARRTGGVPFFVISCAQVLRLGEQAPTAEAVPWDVAQGIRQRLSALPEDARQVLSMAAIVGRRIPYALLIQVTARAEDEVLTALETARQARLLTDEDHATYQFAHDLIREVIEADLGAARRAMLHRRVAEALERAPGALPVERVAFHYGRGGEDDKAAHYLEKAGDHAWAQQANAAAEKYYRELMERLESLGRPRDSARAREKLGGVLATVARYDEALALLEQAATAYRAVGDEEGELRTVARIGRAHAWRGTPAQGIDRLLPTLESRAADRPSSALAELYVVLARLYFYTGRYTDELAAAERAAEMATAAGEARLLAEAEQRRGVALMMLGRPDEALPALESAIVRAEAVGDLFVLCRALVAAGAIYLGRGEAATSLDYRERAVAAAERLGDPAEIAFMRASVGWNLFLGGDWPGARQECERALAVLGSSDAVLAAAYAHHVLGVLCLAEDDEEEAVRHLERCAALAESSGDIQALRFAHRRLAVRDVLAGQAERARARLEPLLDRPGLEEGVVTEFLPMLAWAELERGDTERAGAIVREALRRATASDYRDVKAEAQRIGGMVAARCGRWAEAQWAFEQALDLARTLGYPYEEGRTLYEWGVMLACKGAAQGSIRETWPQARDRLEAALAIFRRLGARRDMRRAERALQRPPDKPRPL